MVMALFRFLCYVFRCHAHRRLYEVKEGEAAQGGVGVEACVQVLCRVGGVNVLKIDRVVNGAFHTVKRVGSLVRPQLTSVRARGGGFLARVNRASYHVSDGGELAFAQLYKYGGRRFLANAGRRRRVNARAAGDLLRRAVLVLLGRGNAFFKLLAWEGLARGEGVHCLLRVLNVLCLVFWWVLRVGGACEGARARCGDSRRGGRLLEEGQLFAEGDDFSSASIVDDKYRNCYIFLALLGRRGMGNHLSFLLTKSDGGFFLLLQHATSPTFGLPYLAFGIKLHCLRPSRCAIRNDLRVIPRKLSTHVSVSCHEVIFKENARRALTFSRRHIVLISGEARVLILRPCVNKGRLIYVLQVIRVIARKLRRSRLNNVLNRLLFVFQALFRDRANVTNRVNRSKTLLRVNGFYFNDAWLPVSGTGALICGLYKFLDRFVLLIVHIRVVGIGRAVSRVSATLLCHVLRTSNDGYNDLQDKFR